MATKKRKPKPFKAASAVKAAARAKIGAPPPTRATPTKQKRAAKPTKHKPTLADLLNGES